MPISHDDFYSFNWEEFRGEYLLEKKDKLSVPRVKGEVQKMASDANLAIGRKLDGLINRIKGKTETIIRKRMKKDSDIRASLEVNKMGDYLSGGASILNIDLNKTTIFDEPVKISYQIFDNTNVRLILPKIVQDLFPKIGGKYEGNTALDQSFNDLSVVLKGVL